MSCLEQGLTGRGSSQRAPHDRWGKAGVADRTTIGRWHWGSKKPIRICRDQKAGGSCVSQPGDWRDQGSQGEDDQSQEVLEVGQLAGVRDGTWERPAPPSYPPQRNGQLLD